MKSILRPLGLGLVIMLFVAGAGVAQDFPLARDDPVIRNAVSYLLSCQNEDGGFGNEPEAGASSIVTTADAACALASTGDLGRAREGGKTPLDYLVANPPDENATGGSIGRYVMGIVAAGGDPRDVSGTDYVERLKDLAKPPRGEENLFSESYILLGLAAAGESGSAEAQAFVTYLRGKSSPSGGWGWGGGAPPDLDTTGIATIALLAAGEDPNSPLIQDAIAYIRSQQSDDGGFVSSGMSADSNSISDGWAMMASNAAGVNPAEWRKGTATPASHLLSCQQESGVFWWKPDSQGGTGFLVEETSFSIIALLGNSIPITAAAPREEGEGATVTVTVLGDGDLLFSRDLEVEAESFVKDGFEVNNPTVLGALAATGLTYSLDDPEGKGSPAVSDLEGYGAPIYFVDGVRQNDPIGEQNLTGDECVVISAPSTVLPLRITAPEEVVEGTAFTIEVASEDLDDRGLIVSAEVEGATVTLKSATFFADFTTDNDGKTPEITLNETGEYWVEAKKDGYISTFYLNCEYQVIDCLSRETVTTTIHVLSYGNPVFSGEVEVPAAKFQKDGIWIDNPSALGALEETGVDYSITDYGWGVAVTALAGVNGWPAFYAQGSMSSLGFASYSLTGGEWLAVTIPDIQTVPVLFMSVPSDVEVGTPFYITVEEEYYGAGYAVLRRPSVGAKAIIEGAGTYVTNATGVASVTLNEAGEYKAKAEKSGCVGTYYIVPGGYHIITATGEISGELIVTKRASRDSAKPGEKLSYLIKICNDGDETLTDVNVTDVLQSGSTLSLVYIDWMGVYVPETNPAPDKIVGNELEWNFDKIEPGDCKDIILVVNVSKDRPSGYELENCVDLEALNQSQARITATDCDDVFIGERSPLVVTKTADKKSAERGKKVKYTIEVCNNYPDVMYDVKVKDVFSHYVEFVFADPAPTQEYGEGDRLSDVAWTFSSIEPDTCEEITLEVLVPEMQDFEFGMEQSVMGEGFVNVANDYSTTSPNYNLNNVVFVEAFNRTGELFEASASANVEVTDPGTELSTREHGSGSYDSEELVTVKTEDKSIEMAKDVSATYATTSLGLYNNRSVAFSSRWTETASGKNRITGTTMSEAYRYATSIDRDSHFKLDETGTSMAFESEFDGMGSFRVFQKPTDEGDPADFESEETYSGSFKVYQVASGSSMRYEKAASGTGSVAADKRIGDEQRSYESGSGAYESDEIIEAATDYIAKEISLESRPTSLDLGGDLFFNNSGKWKEGIWSKNESENKTTFIGEEFSSLDRLDKETIVRGLGDVATEAEFSGTGRFRVISVDTSTNESENESVNRSIKRLRDAEIEIDDLYSGDYSIARRTVFAGDFEYDEPHLSAEKSGEIFYSDDAILARYNITLKNDGNRALGPLAIRDLFPPGAEFVNASERTASLSSDGAEWTYANLGLGDALSITLWLDVTDCRTDEIVNRIEATGGFNGNVVTAAAFYALQTDWLSWIDDASVTATKFAKVDENDPRIVTYTLTVQNLDEETKVATVADILPEGMRFIDSSPKPSSVDGNVVTWTLIDIGPYEAETIVYGAEALRSGRFFNRAVVDARSVNGSVTPPVYASSVIEIAEFEGEGELPQPIWQPPDWGFEYLYYSNNLTCEEIVNLTAPPETAERGNDLWTGEAKDIPGASEDSGGLGRFHLVEG